MERIGYWIGWKIAMMLPDWFIKRLH